MKKVIMSMCCVLAVCAACNKDERREPNEQRTAYQSGREQPPGSAQRPPRFNPDSVKTYRGEVITLMGSPQDVGILIRTEQGEVPVKLGPSCFILEGPVNLEEIQEVEVVGSDVSIEGRPLIIAQELRVNGYTLKLRDKEGNALWTGWTKQ